MPWSEPHLLKPVPLGDGGQRRCGGEERMATRVADRAWRTGLGQVTHASSTPIVALHPADS